MPGLLVRVNSDKQGCLEELAHNKDCFGAAEMWFGGTYLGVVDFKNRLKEKSLFIPEQGLGIVIYGDVYLDRENAGKSGSESENGISRVLLDLYQKRGMYFVQHISGGFSLSIHDNSSKKTIVVTDRLGSSPVYYNQTGCGITLSSEIKGVMCGMESDLDYDMKAIYELFSFSFPLSNRTLFKNIKTLPNASIFIYDHQRNEGRVEKYWKYDAGHGNQQRNAENNLLDVFDDLFTNSIWQRIKDADSVGVFLSGGIDSRVLAGYCKELCDRTNKRLIFYTVGAPGCIQDKIAKRVSALFGVEHQFIEIPDTQISSYAYEIVANGDGHLRIRDSHFVSAFDKLALTHGCYLAGYMGGSVFGHWIEKPLRDMSKKEEVVEYVLKKYLQTVVLRKVRFVFLDKEYDLMKSARKTVQETVEELPESPFYLMFHFWRIEHTLTKYVGPIEHYGNWYLPISDPYVDRDLVDFAMRLPFEVFMDKTFLVNVLRAKFPALSRIDAEHGYLAQSNPVSKSLYNTTRVFNFGFFLSKRIVQRLARGRVLFKRGDYRAYDYWLRTGSKEYCTRTLGMIDDYNPFGFDPKQIKRLLEDHLSCKADNNIILCDIMQLILLNRYMHDRSVCRQQ